MDNKEYVSDTHRSSGNKRNGIKFIILGIVAIALVIVVALLLNKFMSKSDEEPTNLFYKNLVCVYDADKEQWGYANKKGDMIIRAKYEEAYNFADCGLALVAEDSDEGVKYGFIDTKGKTVINLKYDAASSFNEYGIAVVVKEDMYGIINSDGEEIIKPNKYVYIGEFNDFGTAPYCEESDENGKLWGFIDSNGKITVKAKFEEVKNFSDNGFAVAKNENDEWGTINKKGEWIIQPKFDTATEFDSHNRCIVSIDGAYGVVDNKGNYIVKPKYEAISAFSEDEGLAFFKNEDDEWGVMNTNGKIILEPTYDAFVTLFKDGIAIVKDGNDYYMINKSGKEIGEFDKCGPAAFTFADNGLIPVIEIKKNATSLKYGYANKKGDVVIDFDYAEASAFANCGLACVSDGKDYGYINKNGEFVIQPDYDKATDFFDDGYAVVYRVEDGETEAIIINKKGDEIAKFDNVNTSFDTKVHGVKGSLSDIVGDIIDDIFN